MAKVINAAEQVLKVGDVAGVLGRRVINASDDLEYYVIKGQVISATEKSVVVKFPRWKIRFFIKTDLSSRGEMETRYVGKGEYLYQA